MNSDQIAKTFFEQREQVDFMITKKQASWLFGVCYTETRIVSKDINGQFTASNIDYRWDAYEFQYGAARIIITEIVEKQKEEKHPMQVFIESKGFKNLIGFMDAPNYLELMKEFGETNN